MTKHWSKVQYLHQVVQNANIHIPTSILKVLTVITAIAGIMVLSNPSFVICWGMKSASSGNPVGKSTNSILVIMFVLPPKR